MSCWSSNIARLIRPSQYHKPDLQQSRRHTQLMIWKCALAQAVAQDLKDGRSGRRFMHVDDLDLGGIIMYDVGAGLDWDSVFGSPGMSPQELLDAVNAQTVHVPLYACTSFVTGQIMNAFIRDSALAPTTVPTSRGFAVPFDAFSNFDYCAAFDDKRVEEAVVVAEEVLVLCLPELDEEPTLIYDDDDGDSIYSVGPDTPTKTTSDLPILEQPLPPFVVGELSKSSVVEAEGTDIFSVAAF